MRGECIEIREKSLTMRLYAVSPHTRGVYRNVYRNIHMTREQFFDGHTLREMYELKYLTGVNRHTL